MAVQIALLAAAIECEVEALTDYRTPTRADRANIRHAFTTLADRGIHHELAHHILQDLIAEVGGEIAREDAARYHSSKNAARRTPAPTMDTVDPTALTPDENDAVVHMLHRALNAYNGGKRYTVGDNIGTTTAIRAINRSAVARRVKFKGAGRVEFRTVKITKGRAPGRAKNAMFTVCATITDGENHRALTAQVVETRKGLRFTEWNPMIG